MKADFVQGDTGAFLRVACVDAGTGAPIDLSASTAVLRYSVDGGAAVEAAFPVVDAAGGIAQFVFPADVLTPGALRCEVVITTAGGTITNDAPLLFAVRARI